MLLVLCAPAVLRPRALPDALAPADPNSLGLKSRAVNIGNNLYTNQRNVGLKSGAVSSQERVIMARVQYSLKSIVSLIFTM